MFAICLMYFVFSVCPKIVQYKGVWEWIPVKLWLEFRINGLARVFCYAESCASVQLNCVNNYRKTQHWHLFTCNVNVNNYRSMLVTAKYTPTLMKRNKSNFFNKRKEEKYLSIKPIQDISFEEFTLHHFLIVESSHASKIQSYFSYFHLSSILYITLPFPVSSTLLPCIAVTDNSHFIQ